MSAVGSDGGILCVYINKEREPKREGESQRERGRELYREKEL